MPQERQTIMSGRGPAATVGVLALQGAFAAHQQRLTELGAATRLVRNPDDLGAVGALVMPGGESTTMSRLLTTSGLFDDIKARVSDGMPVFGTCAGLILLATGIIDGRDDQRSLGALDVTVRRNGYGRQVDSFEAELPIEGDDQPFPAIFIRAPIIESVGPGVTVLAAYDEVPVLVAQDAIMGAAFHPELSHDVRLHRRFLDICDRQ